MMHRKLALFLAAALLAAVPAARGADKPHPAATIMASPACGGLTIAEESSPDIARVHALGFGHAAFFAEYRSAMERVAQCNWQIDDVALITLAHSPFVAVQRVSGYLIFRYRRQQIALRETTDDHYGERQPLRTGIYRLARIIPFEKTNGFAVSIPEVQFVAPLPAR